MLPDFSTIGKALPITNARNVPVSNALADDDSGFSAGFWQATKPMADRASSAQEALLHKLMV